VDTKMVNSEGKGRGVGVRAGKPEILSRLCL